jgi:DNA-binding CsgD family transcriptional regulator
VVRGLSNAEIAIALTIRAPLTHVARVLAKLGLRTRVHAVIYAYEHGLVSNQEPAEPTPGGRDRA